MGDRPTNDPALYAHANSAGWWDGPARFKQINRCEVAMIQNETLLRAISAVIPGRKIDLGGPTALRDLGDWDACNCVAAPGVTIVADACATGLPERSYAAVATFHSIEHMHDPRAFLNECARLLQPGGHLFIICPDKRHHLHDPSDLSLGNRCFNEWEPHELRALFEETLPSFPILAFDTRQNNFDFDIVARKP